ncbi:MAG TPA: phytanoyl-CoA dioxygenase family protein [Actinopolymorphaceae bacterium]|jgi:ectoine hydroxylase-related dioxygenase (phytanoyl-CoA dioxygenase family)
MLTSNGYVLDEDARRLGELEAVPERERNDRDALRERLRKTGYLYLRGALDRDEVLAFRRYYFRQLESTGLTRPGTDPAQGVAGGDVDLAKLRHILFREIVPGPVYHAFCTQPAVRKWYEWFLDGPTYLHRRKIIRHLRPRETGIGTATQAHYDLLYLRGGTDAVLTSWIPLGDCPLTRAPLIYLEGSHHRMRAEEERAARTGAPRRPAASITADLPKLAAEHDARWLVTDYRAGDMVVHSAYLVHASLDNVDPDGIIRLSTDIRYQRADDTIDLRWQNHWRYDDGL